MMARAMHSFGATPYGDPATEPHPIKKPDDRHPAPHGLPHPGRPRSPRASSVGGFCIFTGFDGFGVQATPRGAQNGTLIGEFLHLVVRTVGPATTPEGKSPQPASTARTRLVLSAVRAKLVLVLSSFAAEISKVSQSGAAMRQAAPKHQAQGLCQPLPLVSPDAFRGAGGVNARFEQGLHRIDVADSGNHRLIEENVPDCAARSPCPISQARTGKACGKRFWTKRAPGGRSFQFVQVAGSQSTEATRIHEPELSPVGEGHDQMSVRSAGVGGSTQPEPTAHTQVDHQPAGRIRFTLERPQH